MHFNDSARGTINETLATLSTNLDATSTDFGKPQVRGTGEVLFCRANGEALGVERLEEMEEMEEFVNAVRARVKKPAAAETGELDLEKARAMVARLITPEGFAAFLEVCRVTGEQRDSVNGI
ncbi:hypothetical protein LTR36_003573 [Oleoguttula mirabilis]|uniref:Uncharacterized protein n=1 Tax=Oleoguttula mirabilis TaxID=1507867 RepID=A0AAV9JIP4_9PEZI|nr:hypothetical protein LTR36_003573 [Oleoguttula mirabilis]